MSHFFWIQWILNWIRGLSFTYPRIGGTDTRWRFLSSEGFLIYEYVCRFLLTQYCGHNKRIAALVAFTKPRMAITDRMWHLPTSYWWLLFRVVFYQSPGIKIQFRERKKMSLHNPFSCKWNTNTDGTKILSETFNFAECFLSIVNVMFVLLLLLNVFKTNFS